MGVSRVEIVEGRSKRLLIDLLGDSVTPETLAEGATAHTANGEKIIGTMLKSRIDANKNVIVLGTLANGKYLFKYEKADGGLIDIGELVLGAKYTNQITISTDTDGSIYDGDGFAENKYLSNGVPGNRNGIDCSGFIPFGYGSSATATGEWVVEMSGITAALDTTFRIAFYDEGKNFISPQLYGSQFDAGENDYGVAVPYELDENGNVTKLDLTAFTAALFAQRKKNISFIRICCQNIDSNSILTVNEEIT